MRPLTMLALLSLAAGSLTAATPDRVRRAVDPQQSTTLPGHLHRLAQAQYDQGTVDPAKPINDLTLLVKLAPDQQADLDTLLRDQQNPSSPQFQKWLTPEEFGDRFGLSRSDESKLTAWLASEGLDLNISRGRNSLQIRGTAGQVAQAFGTQFHNFQVGGQTRFAATVEPSVPEALTEIVAGFIGLDDFPIESRAKLADPNLNSGSSHFLAPEDLATIYNLGPLYAAGIDGTGLSIVVVGQSAVSLTDVRAFRTRYGLPANDPKMGLYSTTDPGFNSAQIEGALDIEWAGALAPKATINYVYGSNAFSAMFFAVQQNISPIITVSYGSCETDYSAPIFRAIGQQANAQGITILVSSGDSGAASCNLNGSGPFAPKGIAPQFPASLPEVTAVGGTQFVEGAGNYWAPTNSPNFGSALSYIPEAAWNESSQSFGLASTGGGASRLFPQPVWQTGPGVPNDGARHVPDISLSAAGHDAYFINYLGSNGGVFGTSASAPAMASIVALLNHYQLSKGFIRTPGLGNINPQLYRLARTSPQVFHDIISGDNIVPCVQGSPDCLTGSFGYKAGPGYDMATGLGSIDANALVTGWNKATKGVLLTLLADPGSRTLNDSVQLTATVISADGTGTPTGTVSFVLANNVTSNLPVGTVPLTDGRATLSVPLYLNQITGGITLSALYSGDTAFSSGGSTLRLTVTPAPVGAALIIPGQPINVWPQPPDAQGLSWFTTLSLRELNNVPALLTGFSIDGKAQDVSQYFPSPNIPPGGTLSAPLLLRNLAVPVTKTFGYTGIDSSGQTWSRQVSALFYPPPSYAYFTLTATPLVVAQNTSADPSCQWPVQLNIDDISGNGGAQLTSLFAGNGIIASGASYSSQIASIFGTSHMDSFGGLQGTLCFAAPAPGGSSQILAAMNNGLFQEVTVTFAGPPAKPAQFSASPTNLSLEARDKPTLSSLKVSISDPAATWTASVFPANRTTSWLRFSQTTGTGNGEIVLTTDGTGFEPGVYRATIVLQSSSATPQVLNVPVMFVLKGSVTGTAIKGAVLYGSSTKIGSPGTLFSIFGTNLANTTKSATVSPLEYKLDGVSATVNGIAAPVLSVKPDVVTIQIPYEVGAGPAVIGINNNTEVAGLQFQMAPAAPAILAETNGTLFATPTVKRGNYATLYVTGIGDVTPTPLTGFAPTTTVVSSLPKPVLPLSVTVGGVQAFVQFAGIGRGAIGMGQVNILLPASTPTGSQPIVITVGGKASPPVNVTVQ